jgi:hypothetical protein
MDPCTVLLVSAAGEANIIAITSLTFLMLVQIAMLGYVIGGMAKSIKGHDKQLQDLEGRMRALEHRRGNGGT